MTGTWTAALVSRLVVDPTETLPWPQSHETMLGSEERRPTLPFNGYGEWVAKLYA